MQLHDLQSPGFVSNGHRLRLEAFRAINVARVQADITKGAATTGKDLRAFFLACAELCPQPATEPASAPAKASKKEST